MSDSTQSPKPDQPGKVGVYICHCGGNISDHVDVEKVCQEVAKLPQVTVARTNMFMCSDPGQELIMEDLRSGKVDRVVVASCAPSLHETTFRGAIARVGANPYLYEHANIREQVSWVHHGPGATAKATRLVAAAAAKADLLRPLKPLKVNAWRHATVIGGGVAGLKAALDLARRGLEVALVEKSAFLGGQVAKLDRLAPTGEEAASLVGQLAQPVLAHDKITVYPQAQVSAFAGYIGNFQLTLTPSAPDQEESVPPESEPGAWAPGAGVYVGAPLAQSQEAVSLETGVIILATGLASYTPRTGEYGYGQSPLVLTLPQLKAHLAGPPQEGRYLEINGRPIRSLALIHCVGSRQIPGIHPEDDSGKLNEYCSRTCCASLLASANRVRQEHPGTRVYDFYRDIRTYGRGQEEIYEEAARGGVVFMRFTADDPPKVQIEASGEYPLMVTVNDTLTWGQEVSAPVDLVVLGTGIEPNDITGLVEMMKLPRGADGFLLEVHPKLRPVELPTAGLLLAGACQAPFSVSESCNAAGAAAVKASALLARGQVELDPFVAEVDLERCTGAGACVEACLKEGALKLVEMEVGGQKVKRAQVTPALCLGCGACVAVCPHQAIQVNGWSLSQYEAMVDQIVAGQEAA